MGFFPYIILNLNKYRKKHRNIREKHKVRVIYNGKGWRIVFGFKSQSLRGISSLKRFFWGKDLYTSLIQFPRFQIIQNLGQGTGGMLQSLEVNYSNWSLLSLDPNWYPAQSPLKLGPGLSTCWFLTPSHTLGGSPPRWEHRCSSYWKIILRLTSQISLRFRKATSNNFPTHCNFGSVLLFPMNLGEKVRIDYVVQIILQAGGVETRSRWISNKSSISNLFPCLPSREYIHISTLGAIPEKGTHNCIISCKISW